MNDRIHSTILDDPRFDRLVDGELTAVEYQALLKTLEEKPALWRPCALAFLEAQAWRSEMGAIRRGQEMAGAPQPAAAPAGRAWRRWLPLLAVAASFVVAFVGGLAVQRHLDRRGGDAPLATGPVHPPRDMLAKPSPAAARDLPSRGQESVSLGNIRLVVDGGQGNQPQHIDIPVYDGSQMGAEWLTQDRPVLTDDVVESLARRGRKVERQIEYLPLPLDDKRQIVVPVEQIQITPVSRRSY
ncbi:MAG TPA: hypothetical protein VMP01_15620 [Pirellulaceae bacterium]|nr:hypothetical protein [Pirellulaceae bacterium]